MTPEQRIASLLINAKLCREKAAEHKAKGAKGSEPYKWWTEAADKAEKQAQELRANQTQQKNL